MVSTARVATTTDASAGVYGVLVDSLDDEHEMDVVRGAIAGTREAGAVVLCIVGRVLDETSPSRYAKNFCFDLLPDEARGVLVLSSALADALGPAGMTAWLERYHSKPVCCVGVPLPGHSSVTVDNRGGTKDAVAHLLREHGARRIAFVRGPEGHGEAEDRLQAFLETLSEHGVEPDTRLIVGGDFARASGVRAVNVLLDERRVNVTALDAIVAANDFMALGVLDELSRREIRVPDQIALVGFDDVESSRRSQPALTTVRQRAEEIGREALRLLTRPDAARSAEQRALSTELVVRRSCGCSESLHLPSSELSSTLLQPGVDTSFVRQRQVILAEVVRAARGSFGGAGVGWEGRLLDALLAELRGDQAGGFGRLLGQILVRIERANVDALLVQEVLSVLRQKALPCVAGDAIARDRLENVLHDARISAATIMSQTELRRAREAPDALRAFSKQARRAMFAANAELSQVAMDRLPALGVEACVIAELEQPEEIAKGGRIVFGFGPGGRRAQRERIALDALHRHPVLEHSGRALFLLPLVAIDRPVGVALLAVSSVNGLLFEELRDLLGTIIGVAGLSRR